VPDFAATSVEFTSRSRALAERAFLRADVACGLVPRETLDAIFPDRPSANAPLHMFVHHGYWRSGKNLGGTYREGDPSPTGRDRPPML
jgi:arylformamidase